MSFFRTAWHAGAAEYGRARAEKYGRMAKGAALLGWAFAGLLVVGIVAAIEGAFGG